MPTFRYRYAEGNPPSPAVLLNLAHTAAISRKEDIWGLVDSGADQTVLPEPLIDELALVKLDQEVVRGFDGQPQVCATYTVLLQVRDLAPVEVEVLGSAHVNHPILGRDVLNRYKIVLDGPNGAMMISDE